MNRRIHVHIYFSLCWVLLCDLTYLYMSSPKYYPSLLNGIYSRYLCLPPEKMKLKVKISLFKVQKFLYLHLCGDEHSAGPKF